MLIALVALQIAAAVPARHLSPRDSGKLVSHARDVEFLYIMDWRHEWEDFRFKLRLGPRQRSTLPPTAAWVRGPTGRCPMTAGVPPSIETVRYDLDPHDAMTHFILGRPNGFAGDAMYFCPMWIPQGEPIPPDEALGIDNSLPKSWRDTVRARRVPVIRLLDSAAHLIPGDAWVAGQRVRMLIDQEDTTAALVATTECRAAAWWCAMLRGYVLAAEHHEGDAESAFDAGLARMPADTLCAWNDISVLLPYTEQLTYRKMSCAEQASINARVWWLANPLYLEPGNERRALHFARRVLGVLHAGNDADEREDMRDMYMGTAVREMVLRYGWPTTMVWSPPNRAFPPPGWSRFDIKLGTYIGITDIRNHRDPARPQYLGPQYHTLPSWSTILDPMTTTDSSWDLGPEREDSLVYDGSWWAPEFYERYEGPLVSLSSQVGFLRRHETAVLAAAPEWNTATTFLDPPAAAAVGVITSGGPGEKLHIVGARMDGAHPRAILTPVESRPLILGIEMVPVNDSGAAGRTRFAIHPPTPLSALPPGGMAISDLILVRAAPGQAGPPSIQDALPRMYGSTVL
ncbi:MAG TPA: hypothetical protein VMH39_10415, partial [Gemmatimonadaceae bacterium]|nr:hypothetical protein [Gemmatimonadaceae bacterium]